MTNNIHEKHYSSEKASIKREDLERGRANVRPSEDFGVPN